MAYAEFDLSMIRDLQKRVDSAVSDIRAPIKANKVFKSTMGNLGSGAANMLNMKLRQTLSEPNEFTLKAFTWDFNNRNKAENGISIFARGRQAAYLQFLLSADPSRRTRDLKVTEKPTDKQWIPTKIFAPSGDITQANLTVWKQMMAVAAGQRKDPSIFVGKPKGVNSPYGIYGRSNYNGRKTLAPWAFPIDGEAKYFLRWDMKKVTKEYVSLNAEKAIKDAIDFRLSRI